MEGKQNFPSDISALRSVKNSFRPVSGLTSENTSDLRLPMFVDTQWHFADFNSPTVAGAAPDLSTQ